MTTSIVRKRLRAGCLLAALLLLGAAIFHLLVELAWKWFDRLFPGAINWDDVPPPAARAVLGDAFMWVFVLLAPPALSAFITGSMATKWRMSPLLVGALAPALGGLFWVRNGTDGAYADFFWEVIALPAAIGLAVGYTLARSTRRARMTT